MKNQWKGWASHPQVKKAVKKQPRQNKVNEKELAIASALREEGIVFIEQYKFDASRKFRIDFYIPHLRLGIEFNGGQWTQGRHTRGAGYARDLEKINLAQSKGITMFQYTTELFSKNGHGTKKIIQDVRQFESARKS